MNESGTNTENDGLSVTTNEEDEFAALVDAVSSGDNDKVRQHFAAESIVPVTEPDAVQEPVVAGDTPPEQPLDTNETDTSEVISTEDADKDASTRDTSKEQQDTPKPNPEFDALKNELALLKSQAGRVASLQSQLAQLQRQVNVQKTAEKVSTQKTEDDESDKKFKERVAALRDVDPVTADILEELRKEFKKEVAEVPKVLLPELTDNLSKADEDFRIQQELVKVQQVHPEALEIFRHPYWDMWKNQLSANQRAWAESDKAEEVTEALTAFKRFVSGFGQPAQATPVAVEPVETVEPVVDPTQQARQRKLDHSATASTNAPVKNQPVADVETMFNEFYEAALKEQGLA